MSSSSFPDYYKILGTSKSATAEEIKQAYRKESLKTHPDRLANATPAEKRKATERFQPPTPDNKSKHTLNTLQKPPPNPNDTHQPQRKMSSTTPAKITNYFAPLPVEMGESDSEADWDVNSPSPLPRPQLPPPETRPSIPPAAPEVPSSQKSTKRKGSTGNSPETQPPLKQQHVEPGDVDPTVPDGINPEDFYRSASPSFFGEDIDMAMEETLNGLGNSDFNFKLTQGPTAPDDRPTSPSLFSDISDSDETTQSAKEKPSQAPPKETERTKKTLPPPKQSTINDIVVPASQLTPRPHKGFPPIYGATTKSLTTAVSTNTRRVWNSIKGPKVFITVAYASPTKTYTLEHVNDIKNIMRKFVKNPRKLNLSPSELTAKTNNTTPQPFLLYGLEEEETKALSDFGVFSTPTLTLVTYPVRKEPDDYLMTLSGFLLEANKDGEAFVKTIVTSTLEHDPTIIDWYIRNQSNLHPKLALYESVKIPKNVAKSTIVHALIVNESTGPQVVWRIYIHTPTLDNKLAAEFIDIAKNINYPSIHGYGYAKRTDFQCGICRGRDHPTAACPLKNIHGFFNNDPNPSNPNNAVDPTPSADKAQDQTDDDTIFDIPENTNLSRGHQTAKPTQTTKGRGAPTKPRRGIKGLPK
ncbi:hypothetical protein MD484_g4, partial [Candolleomyces efflorescens]